MSTIYPINVCCIDGYWGCDGRAPSEDQAIREVLRLYRESDSESGSESDDLDPGLWRAYLDEVDLLDGQLSHQRLSGERLREVYWREIDELGARLVRGEGRWHLWVDFWAVSLSNGGE